MGIICNAEKGQFHLFNESISYIMGVMPNGQLGQMYFGKKIHHRNDFGYLAEMTRRSMTSCVFEDDLTFSLEQMKQEFPSYGTTDYRMPAVDIKQQNGSRITDFKVASYEVFKGKPVLPGLPATYTENENEADTLCVVLEDGVLGLQARLSYTIFNGESAVARSVCLVNNGRLDLEIQTAMSMCLDLPDSDYEMLQLSGAWARERHMIYRKLVPGIQSVASLRGHSSPHHNPFLALKRFGADEDQGEVIGCSLIYSGNFLAQAEVDTFGTSRITMGIHPYQFSWNLPPGESFQTPEAVIVYSDHGLNAMSQTFHRLYRERLARGIWRDKARPIVINNWEATRFTFMEEDIIKIAKTAADSGIEMFVLDDGWFGERDDESSGLGDWSVCRRKLPEGISGLADRIKEMGMEFGLWFEPEMVNKDSELFRNHPDWILQVPGRKNSHGRFQQVLDFSRPEVEDAIFEQMKEVLSCRKVSYIKWDMNRSITECYSGAYPPKRQGEIFHRYILGVYHLYERLLETFPEILFESCASGGGRFDPGMLYYAPQCWTSDNTDAVERLKIQYGTSLCYPVSSMGAHVSAVPNQQMNRITPLKTRADVAYFGTFGYELDLNQLCEEEMGQIRKQVQFMKEHRRLIQFGTFYRLQSPFEDNVAAWMVVSEDKKEALIGRYRILSRVNGPYERLRLKGLSSDVKYTVNGSTSHFGDELMNLGLIVTDGTAGRGGTAEQLCGDFMSALYYLKG